MNPNWESVHTAIVNNSLTISKKEMSNLDSLITENDKMILIDAEVITLENECCPIFNNKKYFIYSEFEEIMNKLFEEEE